MSDIVVEHLDQKVAGSIPASSSFWHLRKIVNLRLLKGYDPSSASS